MGVRRRRAGAWFPNLGTQGPEGNIDDDDAGLWGLFVLGDPGVSQTFLASLTFDAPIDDEADELGTDRSHLADFIGQDYILKRIVGKFFAALDQSPLNNEGAISSPAALLTAGFFVARAEDSTTESAAASLPIGTETAAEQRENYSPAVPSTIREPWIWRRQWILGNRFHLNQTVGFGAASFPFTTAEYHDVMDGPHIDARSKRRVSSDERLWFAASARGLGPAWDDPFDEANRNFPPVISFHLDYRIFGTLIKASGKSAF